MPHREKLRMCRVFFGIRGDCAMVVPRSVERPLGVVAWVGPAIVTTASVRAAIATSLGTRRAPFGLFVS